MNYLHTYIYGHTLTPIRGILPYTTDITAVLYLDTIDKNHISITGSYL